MSSNAPYPGNTALPAEVKDRVLSTFHQSLQLFRQGNIEDAVAGCEFILKMDALFEPAQKLLAKAKDPSMNIDVENLVPQAGGNNRLNDAATAFQQRDYQRAMEIASEVLSSDPMNANAQQIAQQAQERIEAAPFVQQFLQKCRSQIDLNNFDAARSTLEKVRALDPTEPAIRECEQLIEVASMPSAPTGFAFGEPAAFDLGAPAQAASPSFVVEEPPAAAPPADFGFTFEEAPVATAAPEVPGYGFAAAPPEPPPTAPPPPAAADGFSFDAPAASPFAAGEAQTFDFATAPTDISADDQMKISQFIAEGDEAYDGGDYARAVDIWSRVFLIDVTNDEASQRIEKAKKKRSEAEANVDALMIEATQAFEGNDLSTARTKFEEVLRIEPDNFNATQYLERINSAPATAAVPPPSPVLRGSSDILDDDEFGYGAPAAESLEPRVAPKQRPAAAAEKKAAPAGKPKGLLLGAAAAALIIVLGGGWFAYSKFFGTPKFDPAKTAAIMDEAQSLAKGGKFDQAINSLLAIQPDDPQHDKALEMIADLKKKKAEAAEMVDGRPAGIVFSESIANGESAYLSHDYLRAKAAFEKAASIRPLPADMKTMYDAAAQQVGKLDSALNHYKEGKYDLAIAALEPLLLEDPENKSVKQLLINSHFNTGAVALREDRDKDALAEFDKVLAYDPDDELAKRSKEIIGRYSGQPKDLLYKIYVKYLPVR